MDNSTLITMDNVTKTLQEYNDEEANRRMIPVIYLVLLMVIGIPGNILVLIIYPSKFPRTTHRLFITGLAIADLLVCVVTLPFEITEMRFQYTFYITWACKLFRACNNLFALSSIFILFGLSADRYRRVCKPLKLQMSTRQANIFMVCSAGLAALFSLPNFFISGTRLVKLGYNVTGFDCSLSDQFAKTKIPILYGGALFLVFLIAMVTLIVIYSFIGHKICTHANFRRKFSKGSTTKSTSETPISNENQNLMQTHKSDKENKDDVFDDKKQSDEKRKPTKSSRKTSKKNVTKEDMAASKITKIAFAISVAFILSYLPHLTISLLTALKGKFLFPPGPVVSAVLPIVTRSFAINNVVNPIIYGLMDKRFRDHCRLLFRCK